MNNNVCIGMVGTRKMSAYGREYAYRIGYELGASGSIVVSGMALGVDGVSACGAISGGGKTVAVLGCGIDVVYPREHAKLMNIIASNGAVVTEYAPGTPPIGSHFPVRNRIISGMCIPSVITAQLIDLNSILNDQYSQCRAYTDLRREISSSVSLLYSPGARAGSRPRGPIVSLFR